MFSKHLLPFFLAQVQPDLRDPETLRKTAQPIAGVSREVLIVLICALALSLLLFIWAFFVRKRPRTARGALVVERAHRKDKAAVESEEDSSRRRRRKRRPEHPDNWGRNPTLGETGGLPPAREDEDDLEIETEPDPGAGTNGSNGSAPRRPR
jgi:hypothetical protein